MFLGIICFISLPYLQILSFWPSSDEHGGREGLGVRKVCHQLVAEQPTEAGRRVFRAER